MQFKRKQRIPLEQIRKKKTEFKCHTYPTPLVGQPGNA